MVNELIDDIINAIEAEREELWKRINEQTNKIREEMKPKRFQFFRRKSRENALGGLPFLVGLRAGLRQSQYIVNRFRRREER